MSALGLNSYLVSFCSSTGLDEYCSLCMLVFYFLPRFMKRASEFDSLSSTVKRRKVSLATYQKWETEMDQDCGTLSWLDCETSGVGTKKTVEKLKYKVYIQYRSNIEGRRN